MNQLVKLTIQDGIAVITIDNPPVNALSPGVPEGIGAAIAEVGTNPEIRAAVMIGAGRTFIAGADITELEKATWGLPADLPGLHDLLMQIEDCPKTVVVAIHGTAFGGGLEVAMAGHYRVAVKDAVVGQPEVNLGIIPGAEGTQRLPRLAGVEKALEMCVTGKPVKAGDALAAGILDAIVEGDLLTGALAFAAAHPERRKTRERNEKLGAADANAPLFATAWELARKIRRNQFAPMQAIAAIEAATKMGFEDGCARERGLFDACLRNDQSKSLVHAFFAERACGKVTGIGKEVVPKPVAKVAIIGAGTMGAGIAMACVNSGLSVRIKDTTQEALDRGLKSIQGNYDTSVKRGRFTAEQVTDRVGRITLQLDYSGFEEADLIIEAAFESMSLKKQIFGELDAIAKPGCVLGSNTSTLSIDEIAATTKRPEAVVGLHFFSPANVMRLLEIVRGKATSNEVLATALAFGKKLGKVGVVAGNCPGFIGNRMMFPYMYEAQFLIEEGALPEQVDAALTGFGMAMGIFAVDDMAGIDVACRVRQELGHFSEPGARKPLVQDRLFQMGRYGQKTGRGWFIYGADRKASLDPDVTALIRGLSAAAGIPQRAFTNEEIVDRLVLALVNEGAKLLDEGFALRASDIDTVYLNGYGFPGWRGGPMMYASVRGLADVAAKIAEFHGAFGARWEPAPLLLKLAAQGKNFRDYDSGREQ